MKIIEFEQVYLEIPDNILNNQDRVIDEERSISMSIEELQKRLEETQSLHL